MKKILILFAHPAFEKSRVNKILIDGLPQQENVTFHDLYVAYPELSIDVKHEQKLMEEHDVIVFHHPFFWYSTPAIFKEWQDLVLEHNWAYGKNGNALAGKWMFNVMTTGGKAEAYSEEGYNHFTIRELLAPIEQTASLCKMYYLPPFVIHGTHSITDETVKLHRNGYFHILKKLSNDQIELDKVRKLKYLNDYLD